MTVVTAWVGLQGVLPPRLASRPLPRRLRDSLRSGRESAGLGMACQDWHDGGDGVGLVTGGLTPAARFATAPPPPSRLSGARGRESAGLSMACQDWHDGGDGVGLVTGGLTPAARFATAPPPPSRLA